MYAATKKGNRPSYMFSKPEVAIPLWLNFVKHLEIEFAKK
jgi:D-Tyr-tRNAtyr deacylase